MFFKEDASTNRLAFINYGFALASHFLVTVQECEA